MNNAIDSFPLQWPLGRKRTQSYKRTRSRFSVSPGRATEELQAELKRLGARSVVISSNVSTYRRAGIDIPYANQTAAIEDPGVAVYYLWNSKQYVFTCDKWKTVPENIYSIAKTIDAIRSIERWGTGDMMEAAFQGFTALPPPETTLKPWYEVLEVPSFSGEEAVKNAFRRLAQVHHPDKGGDTKRFQEINEAWQTFNKAHSNAGR